MSLNGSADDPRVTELRQQQQRRMNRFFIGFVVAEVIAFGVVAVLVYVLGVFDPNGAGLWLLVAVVVVAAASMMISLFALIRRHARELREVTGG